jgi:hypothetical protein
MGFPLEAGAEVRTQAPLGRGDRQEAAPRHDPVASAPNTLWFLASAATLNRGEYLPLADADHSGEAASISLSAAEV